MNKKNMQDEFIRDRKRAMLEKIIEKEDKRL
jgi:hypothetical protein